MVKRRDFLKTITTGAALFPFYPMSVFSATGSEPDRTYVQATEDCIWDNPSQRPVWKDADVIVVGATSGGVAAAIAAAKAGARVFVVSSFPYPGEDICGSFMYWPKERESSSYLFTSLFPGVVAPYPLHVKSVLENEMIRHNIEFVYSSFISNIITDSGQKPAGICIANRSGCQVIRGKVIIDATHHAVVARLAGVPFHTFKPGKHRFRYVVIGNKEKKDSSILESRQIYPAFNVDNKSLLAWEYIFDIPLADDSYAALMDAEQKIRDLTWDVDQGDSSDIPYYIPSSYMKSSKPFEPDGIQNLYVLGPCSAFSRDEVLSVLEPACYMEYGEIIGKEAGNKAVRLQTPSDLHVRPIEKTGSQTGKIAVQSPFRPFAPFALAHFAGGGIPVLGNYDVVVVGGGTAGAPAAISTSRKGVKTLLLEYLHGLGGIGTYGHIGRYTVGHRQGFTAEVDEAMRKIAPPDHPRHIKKDSSEWPLDWKAEWYRKEIQKSKGDVWFHTIVTGALLNGGRIEGVLVNTPMGQGIIRCKRVIDSTGSADIAIAAGAKYEYTGKESLAIQGAGLAKFSPNDHYNNTDWTFVDDSDIIDITRLFIQAKIKNQGCYDVGKLPQTRERRRIIADYNVSVFDMMNKRTYSDTISYHKSNFDTHGFTEDIFFTIKPPDHGRVYYDVKLPLRSLLPKGLDGILVTGLGCGAHRDAMPVIRMQPDLQNQGYAAGLVVSASILGNTSIRMVRLRDIQQELVDKGNLPEEVLQEDNTYQFTQQQMEEAVKGIPGGYVGLEKTLAFPEKSIPLLTKAYKKASETDKLYYANVLCMMGKTVGWETILKKVQSYKDWDKGWNYRGMHQFGYSMSELDNYVVALGYCRKKEVLPEVSRLAGLLTTQSEFSHFRAVAIAFEALQQTASAEDLYRLLQLEGMTGHHIVNQYDATQKITLNIIDSVYVLEDMLRNKSLKELFIAKALYLCGDKENRGRDILENYAKGQEGHYARFAWESLNTNI